MNSSKSAPTSIVNKAQQKLEKQRHQIDVLQQEIAQINRALQKMELQLNLQHFG